MQPSPYATRLWMWSGLMAIKQTRVIGLARIPDRLTARVPGYRDPRSREREIVATTTAVTVAPHTRNVNLNFHNVTHSLHMQLFSR